MKIINIAITKPAHDISYYYCIIFIKFISPRLPLTNYHHYFISFKEGMNLKIENQL